MLVQNKLSKKYGLASKNGRFIEIIYEDDTKVSCIKSKFQQNFIKIDKLDKTLVYIVNGAYFTNKWDADWQIKFLKNHNYEVKIGFMYDTIKNIMERISNV